MSGEGGHGMAKGQELGMVPRWQMEAAFHTSRFDISIHADLRNLLYLYMDGISHLYIIHTDYGVCFTIVSLNVCMLYPCAYWFTYLCDEILILGKQVMAIEFNGVFSWILIKPWISWIISRSFVTLQFWTNFYHVSTISTLLLVTFKATTFPYT